MTQLFIHRAKHEQTIHPEAHSHALYQTKRKSKTIIRQDYKKQHKHYGKHTQSTGEPGRVEQRKAGRACLKQRCTGCWEMEAYLLSPLPTQSHNTGMQLQTQHPHAQQDCSLPRLPHQSSPCHHGHRPHMLIGWTVWMGEERHVQGFEEELLCKRAPS